MDALPIMLTGVCERVEAIRVDRIQDARIRRLPFQQKIGAGLTREQFQKKVDDRSVRHVGLAESIAMIADALGWKLDKITDEIQPKMADGGGRERVPGGRLPATCAASSRTAIGYRNGEPVITLHMEAYLGAPESYDAVEIAGSPALKMKIAGGVHGDIATASIAVNSLPKILTRQPGPAHHAGHAAAVVLRRRAVAFRARLGVVPAAQVSRCAPRRWRRAGSVRVEASGRSAAYHAPRLLSAPAGRTLFAEVRRPVV